MNDGYQIQQLDIIKINDQKQKIYISEEALTSVHYDGLQIPSVENQSWLPSHHHQSTKNKN